MTKPRAKNNRLFENHGHQRHIQSIFAELCIRLNTCRILNFYVGYFFPFQIFLHGNNLNSLHQLIHPEFLPSEFGGTLPPYDMGTWARTLLGPDYSDENDYTHTSYNAMHVKHTCSNLERECSPKPMKR